MAEAKDRVVLAGKASWATHVPGVGHVSVKRGEDVPSTIPAETVKRFLKDGTFGTVPAAVEAQAQEDAKRTPIPQADPKPARKGA